MIDLSAVFFAKFLPFFSSLSEMRLEEPVHVA